MICAVLAAVLTLTACASAPADAPSPPLAGEEDSALALELEQTFLAQAKEEENLYQLLMAGEEAMLDLTQTVQPVAVKSLSIPQTFRITRPAQKLTTTYATYFITGTSDSEQPVYFGKNEIERLGTKGTFGVLVKLEMGTNTFKFSQGDQSQTVTIVRKSYSDPAKTPISEIRQSSIVPAHMSGVKVGEKLSVGCIAPSGATVKASYNGKAVTLKQANTDIKTGLPAAFTGKITVDADGFDPDITQKDKKVSYSMTYKGTTKKYSSNGVVYVAGENSDIAVEIVTYLGFVYPKASDPSVFKEVVKAGARDYIVGQTNEHFELASGGFIPKSEQVKIVTGEVRVTNKLSDMSFSKGSKSESITLHGTRPAVYDTWISEDHFYLRLYNTSGTPRTSLSNGRLVSSCSVTAKDGAVTYKFPLKGLVWGYDVSFDGGDLTLLLKYKPKLGGGSQPLEGVTILLDPGHGGTDPGALGLAGTTGPTEADVNLANARATQEALQELGAKVYMTRKEDSYLSLNGRLELIERAKCDFYVSLHHNSLAESTDANKVSGMEIYYHTTLSKKFADRMMTSLSSSLKRNGRFVRQDYYRVTLMPYAPALLVELGFMSNPVEYERAATASEMNKVAQAVANGIVSVLK